MNNTDKLLKAFIEASGYEVEETTETKTEVVGEGVIWGTKVVDYKVTKKQATESNAYQVILDVQSAEWSCIVEYITNHAGGIENNIHDLGTLQPMLNYFNRNCNENN